MLTGIGSPRAYASPPPNTSDAGGWSLDPSSLQAMGYGPSPDQQMSPATSQLQGILDNLRAYYGPQYQSLNQTLDLQRQGLLARQGNYADQESYLRQGYGQDLGRLGIQRDINGINQNYIQGQMGSQDAILANLGKLPGLTNADLANQLHAIQLSNIQDAQKAQSAKIAGGFGMAPGQQIGMNQINESADIARQKAQLSTERQRISEANQLIGAQMTKAGMQKEYDVLRKQAEGFGIDEASLLTGLNKSLSALGLDRTLNSNQILQLAASEDPQRAALGKQFINDLMQQIQGLGLSTDDILGTVNALRSGGGFGVGSY